MPAYCSDFDVVYRDRYAVVVCGFHLRRLDCFVSCLYFRMLV